MIADIFAAALQFFCEKIDMFLGILTTDITTFQNGAISDDSRVFGYMAEMSFLFLMLFGMLKGTDKLVNRVFGI